MLYTAKKLSFKEKSIQQGSRETRLLLSFYEFTLLWESVDERLVFEMSIEAFAFKC